jgi:uncharacterized protein YhbP (UPF0306 family)
MEGINELLQVAAMTLGITGADGTPHAATVYFAAVPSNTTPAPGEENPPISAGPGVTVEGGQPCPWRLAFFSSPNSYHARCLATDPRAAATIYPETQSWQTILGLQLHGRVLSLPPLPPGALLESTPLAQSELAVAAWQAYRAKFPFIDGMQEIIARNRLHIFTPDWLRLIDNRRGFGFRQEWRYA